MKFLQSSIRMMEKAKERRDVAQKALDGKAKAYDDAAAEVSRISKEKGAAEQAVTDAKNHLNKEETKITSKIASKITSEDTEKVKQAKKALAYAEAAVSRISTEMKAAEDRSKAAKEQKNGA